MLDERIEFSDKDVKKWSKALKGMSMKEKVKATGIGEGSLRNAVLHAWGTESTREKLNTFASKKQLA